MAVGEWQLETGVWRLVVGEWQLETGSWRMAVGEWQLETRSWRLAVGEWQFSGGSDVAGGPEALRVLSLAVAGRTCECNGLQREMFSAKLV